MNIVPKSIVPIEEWLDDPYYLGPEAMAIRPFWKKQIIDFFRGDRKNMILTGSQRAGKTFCIIIIILRYIYEIERYYPHFPELFGLSPSTLPKIIFFSFSANKADSTGISRLIRMVDSIPYFQYYKRQRRAISSLLSFPWVEVIPGTQLEHGIGEDVFGAVIDEANIRGVARSNAVREAQDLFMEIRMRSETTFSLNGKWGGFSAIISTAGKSTSFTDMQVSKAKRDKDYFLVEAAVYDVYPEGHSAERFAVYPGDGAIRSFIVDNPSQEVQQAVNGCGVSVEQFVAEKESLLVHPPVSLRHFYEEDLESALQNLSGLTRVGSSLFVSNRAWISRMFDSSMKPPFGLVVRDDMPFFGIYDTLLPEELISEDLINEHYSGERVYAAFDISRVNDATGFSAIFYSEEERKILPLVVVPIYLNRNVAGNEIDQVKLVGLVLALYRMGVNFRYITADGFSSDFLIQRFKLIFGNEFAGRFSVDKNKAAHITMLNFMKLGMYRLYPVPRLAYELEHLVDDPVAGMVDHPPNTDPSNPVYFKDVSDSLAAASFHLSVYEELSYEDLMVSGEVAKARSQRAVAEDGEEDFYSDIDEGGEDFYSDLSVYEDELPVDPLTKLERDIRP